MWVKGLPKLILVGSIVGCTGDGIEREDPPGPPGGLPGVAAPTLSLLSAGLFFLPGASCRVDRGPAGLISSRPCSTAGARAVALDFYYTKGTIPDAGGRLQRALAVAAANASSQPNGAEINAHTAAD